MIGATKGSHRRSANRRRTEGSWLVTAAAFCLRLARYIATAIGISIATLFSPTPRLGDRETVKAARSG